MTNSTSAENYSIAQISRLLNLTPRALRFYEDKQLIKPKRIGTHRSYSSQDKERLELIARGKRLGFSLSEIKDLFDLYSEEDRGLGQLESLLSRLDEKEVLLHQQKKDIGEILDEIEMHRVTIKKRIAKIAGEQEAIAQAYARHASESVDDF